MRASAFDLNDRLLDFGIVIAGIVKCIPGDLVGRHVAGQLIRAGTAPVARHSEAQGAESKRDFIHKLRLALKELREARTWLRFVTRLHLVEQPVDVVLDECDELITILVVSLRSAAGTYEQRPTSNPPRPTFRGGR